ncbi:hypothetical protein CPB84DRAFT_1851755 [Gymnopilus junonius]|uniref:Uncharacterized protein n=1 Tax=Gymnopilus junonius TaxID=109634 RepID=A0A9P5THA6_GYMJU|nr:hypothetical protein CPB84DRAFT_1851755 [Gymnopilus junonius]
MAFRPLAIAALLSNYLVFPNQAAIITLYTPAIVRPTGGPQVASQAFGTNSILSVSAIDVLPGNITEYAIGQVVTEFTEVGSGTAASLSASVTTFSYTIEEGASFIGNSFNFDEFTVSGSASQTISTPVTGVAGCTVTAPPSASATEFHCAQVQVFNGTKTETIFYTATAAPMFTLTESTPPPTASATTAILFPSGVPASNGSKQLSSGGFKGIFLALIMCLVVFVL